MKTFKDFFGAELPSNPKDVEDMLIANSVDTHKNFSYMKRFDKQDLNLRRNQLENLSIRIKDMEEEKKEWASNWKDEMKPIKEEYDMVVEELKTKASQIEEDVYMLLEEESKTMYYFNRQGEVVYERPANAGELQPSVFSIKADFTGTYDK